MEHSSSAIEPGRRGTGRRHGYPRAPVACALAAVLAILVTPGTAAAQRSLFIEHLVGFRAALEGRYGDEGPQIRHHLDRMSAALAAWDQALAQIEADLAPQLPAAPPDQALRIRLLLAGEYLQRARFDDALRELEAAAGLAPRQSEFPLLQGLVHEAMGRPADALEPFRRAWALDPDHPAKAYLLADRLRVHDGAADLEPLLDVLLASQQRGDRFADPTGPFVTLALVRDEASPVPLFVPARYADGFDLLARHRYEEALARFEEAAGGDPLLVAPAVQTPRMAQGIAALRQGRLDAAVVHLDAAAAAMPDSAEAHRLLGLVLAAQGRYTQAVDRLETAVRLEPDDDRARVALGRARADAGDWEGAASILVDTLEAWPDAAEARWVLASVYEALDRGAEALEEVERAADSFVLAGRGELYRRLAALAVQHGDTDRAAAALRRRVELDLNSAVAHRDLGFLQLNRWRPDEALLDLGMALLLEPDDPVTLELMGQLHLRTGRYAVAEPLLRRALTFDVDSVPIRNALARTLVRLGRKAEAQEHLAEVRRIQTEQFQRQRQAFEKRPRRSSR